ncbi:Rhodanese-like domain-containing protein [Fictibacillus macauensis ZFHKF-1]|uniref:Rhodanese-like domain-containing protein n=1 Tax=Fictibacillus macauensis ZFHKF-1 TaxID=1196324 RepID=I8AIH9_9BACL|nr:rhodanese-like domain-containing protein [Fictibacillus macauensis]EIT85522.1 Rhodanese-like domain-containing protein [Fictibacillus macauensis ZFHKF-1]
MELGTITAQEVKERLKKGEELSLIDVREDEEVAEGMIEEAVHIKMMDVPSRLSEIDADKEHIIVCRSGKRSENVAYFLLDHGYTVKNMTGGMLAYNEAE